MALFANLQSAQEMAEQLDREQQDTIELPGSSSNSLGPLSPFSTNARKPLGALNGASTRETGIFKMSGFGPKIVPPTAAALKASPFRKRRSSMMSEGEYGFDSMQNSRRNSLDDGICSELMVTPQRIPKPVAEEEEEKAAFDNVELRRTRNAQRIVANVRMIRDARSEHAGKRTKYGFDSKQLSTEMRVQSITSEVHRVNPLALGPGAGQKTLFSSDAREIHRQMNVPKPATFNGQIRGETAGDRTRVTADSAQIRNEVESQNVLSTYRRVNEQFRTDGTAAKLPADSMEFVRAKTGQQNLAAVRLVNEQARGELVGKPNRFNTDSKQLSQEMKAQSTIAAASRVSEQARGELAGKKNFFNADAREMQRNMAIQASVADSSRINQQVANLPAATILKDSLEFSRAKNGQSAISESRKVNGQVRGQLAGKRTSFGASSVAIKSATSAQSNTSDVHRVSEQMRGEFAGQRTAVDASSLSVTAAMNAPRAQLVNNQIMPVGKGFVPFDAVAFSHIKALREGEAEHRARSNTMKGKSSYGYGAPQFSAVSTAPKLNTVNQQIRGSSNTKFGSDSISMRTVAAAPRLGAVNPGMTGRIDRSGAEVSHSTQIEEWEPDSHKITPMETVSEEAKSVPEVPEETVPEPEWSAAVQNFGLRKTNKNFTLERKKKMAQSTEAEPELPSDFKSALSRFR